MPIADFVAYVSLSLTRMSSSLQEHCHVGACATELAHLHDEAATEKCSRALVNLSLFVFLHTGASFIQVQLLLHADPIPISRWKFRMGNHQTYHRLKQ